MTHHFEGTPIGSEIGIHEHQKHIDDLEGEESAIRSAIDGGQSQQKRLNEISDEISYRRSQQEELKKFL